MVGYVRGREELWVNALGEEYSLQSLGVIWDLWENAIHSAKKRPA